MGKDKRDSGSGDGVMVGRNKEGSKKGTIYFPTAPRYSDWIFILAEQGFQKCGLPKEP